MAVIFAATMLSFARDVSFREPFEEAIATSGISPIEIEQVVLFGAGTRVPKIQEQIKEFTGA